MVFNILGADTHMHTDFTDKSNFKRPGVGWPKLLKFERVHWGYKDHDPPGLSTTNAYDRTSCVMWTPWDHPDYQGVLIIQVSL